MDEHSIVNPLTTVDNAVHRVKYVVIELARAELISAQAVVSVVLLLYLHRCFGISSLSGLHLGKRKIYR
jgi:hypothetical protein